MWITLSDFRAHVSFRGIYSFLVSLKGLLVRDTFSSSVDPWSKKPITASSTSSTSVLKCITAISTSILGMRWRTDPLATISSLKAEYGYRAVALYSSWNIWPPPEKGIYLRKCFLFGTSTQSSSFCEGFKSLHLRLLGCSVQLTTVDVRINRLVPWKQLKKYHTFPILPTIQHNLFRMHFSFRCCLW